METLLELGVPFDQRTGQGLRPIDLAKDNPETVKLLLQWAAKAAKKEISSKSEL